MTKNSEARRARWNQRYADSALVWSAEPNQVFVDMVADLPRGTALDLGCGEGRNAIWLAVQGWQVTGVDFAFQGLEKAEKLAAEQGVSVNWLLADVNSFDQPESFNLVAVVFLHTSSDERQHWLSAAVTAVAPGGYFVYIGHDPSNITDGVGGPQDPDVLPDVDSICASLEEFEVMRAEVVMRQVNADPGHGSGLSDEESHAVDALVVARKRH